MFTQFSSDLDEATQQACWTTASGLMRAAEAAPLSSHEPVHKQVILLCAATEQPAGATWRLDKVWRPSRMALLTVHGDRAPRDRRRRSTSTGKLCRRAEGADSERQSDSLQKQVMFMESMRDIRTRIDQRAEDHEDHQRHVSDRLLQAEEGPQDSWTETEPYFDSLQRDDRRDHCTTRT